MGLRDLVIAPSPLIRDPKKRTRAQTLAALLLVRGTGLTVLFAYLTSIGAGPRRFSVFAAVLLNLIAYAFSRGRRFEIGAVVVILEALIAIPFTIVLEPEFSSVLAAPVWLGMSIFISGLVMPTPFTVGTLVMAMMAFLFIGSRSPPEFIPVVFSEFLFTLTASALVLMGALLRDRLDRELAAERARMAQASKRIALGQFAAGVAHEINNPLATMLLTAESIARRLPEAQIAREELATKVGSLLTMGRRVASVVDSVRELSGEAQNARVQLVPINALIETALSLWRERLQQRNIELIVDLPDDEAFSQTAPAQLSQVIFNLLSNSFDAVRDLPERWVRIDGEVAARELLVSVTDSGRGIPAREAEAIFQPFFTTKEVGKGAGLSLSVSKQMLQNEGGDLIYDPSSPNTRFVMRIPRTARSLLAEPVSPGPAWRWWVSTARGGS